MTGKELFLRMLTLGGRTSFNAEVEEEAKYHAANMALDDVNALFPVTDVARILHFPLCPVLSYPGIAVHKGGEDITIHASGVKSLAFAISGTGMAKLYKIERDETGEIKYNTRLKLNLRDQDVENLEWNDLNEYAVVRYLGAETEDNCEIALVFSGDYSYMIKDLAFYSDATSGFIEDVIPYSYWIQYDIDGMQYANGRFAEFASTPIMIADGEPYYIDKYKIYKSSIYLPRDLCAEVEVKYRKKPTIITADNEDNELDIDAELHSIAALKAAYYIYNLIDPEAAESCLAEYNRQLGLVLSRTRKVRTPRKLQNKWEGW